MITMQLTDDIRTKLGNYIIHEDHAYHEQIHYVIDINKYRDFSVYLHREIGMDLSCMFASKEDDTYSLNVIFENKNHGYFIYAKSFLQRDCLTFPSIANHVFIAERYEREIHDYFGLVPEDHPDLKRLILHTPEITEPIEFNGYGTYEIPVGPVHAGIIEPGHFRFSVAGEKIYNLDAQLYFVHKGIEKAAAGMNFKKVLFLSERISGDETVANSLAYCMAIEKIAGIDIPERAEYTRMIFAEVERITAHFGDLAGICLDTAYGFGAFQYRMMRGWMYLLADVICGMRFLRSVNTVGGVRKDFLNGKTSEILDMLEKVKVELLDTASITMAHPMFMDRLNETGILDKQTAVDLVATGPPARASGLRGDVRRTPGYLKYDDITFSVPLLTSGDVKSRMIIKIDECIASIDIIEKTLRLMKDGPVRAEVPSLPPNKVAIGFAESPRGSTLHFVKTGKDDTLERYKIRTASYTNWAALCHAVSGNIVPDFPLINKSFNLSYAGNDL